MCVQPGGGARVGGESGQLELFPDAKRRHMIIYTAQ